jgi:hypothetical protein
MQSSLMPLIGVAFFGIGVAATWVLIPMDAAGAHVFEPLTVAQATAVPQGVYVAGTIAATDPSAQQIALQTQDPYTLQTIVLTLTYDERTRFGAASYASGARFTADQLRTGMRVIVLLNRGDGRLYIRSLSESKQYE